MLTYNLRGQLRRLCPYGVRLSSLFRVSTEREEETDTKTKEQRAKQMYQFFLSGVRFLKDDADKLKSNLKNRGISLDVDSMVGRMVQNGGTSCNSSSILYPAADPQGIQEAASQNRIAERGTE